MSGPMSSPCGDRSIVTNPKKREDLLSSGKLFTGKTDKDTASGKWARHLQNRHNRSEYKVKSTQKREK